MFERNLMISGLRKQRDLLGGLVGTLERSSLVEEEVYSICGKQSEEIAKNLRKLRRIKKDYFTFLERIIFLD